MRFISGLIALLVGSASLRAEPQDIAELFPADMLLYAEINKPDVVAKDLTAFLKGSSFEKNTPEFRTLREQKGQNSGFNTSIDGLIAAMLAPEMLKEAARCKGIAGGIVGSDKHGDPEYLFAVLPGDNQLPGFLMRSYITARADIRKVATFEGVELFQRNIAQYENDPLVLPGGGAPVQKLVPIGPVYVNHAGLLIVGSNKDHVSAVIRRFNNKEKAAGLPSNAGFAVLAKERAQPGILLLADAKRLAEQIDRLPKVDAGNWLAFKRLLPPVCLGTLIARLEFKDEGIRLHARIKLDGKTTSPLAELLEGGGLQASELPATNSPMTFTVALPTGDQRATRFLTAIDSIIKSTGTLGPNASEVLQELEDQKVLSRRDLEKINRVSFVLPPVKSWVKSEAPLPAVLLHMTDSEAAAKFESAVPAVLEVLGGTRSDAVTETIEGIKVRTLVGSGMPFGKSIHYGHNGSTFAIALSRQAVSDVLQVRPDAERTAHVTGALKNVNRPAMVAVWSWVETTRGPMLKDEKKGPRNGVAYGPIASAYSPYSPGGTGQPYFRFSKDAFAQFDGLPPLVVALSRNGNELVLDVVQTDPKRVREKGLTHLFSWFVNASANWRSSGYSNSFDGPIDEIVPLVAPQPLLPPGQ